MKVSFIAFTPRGFALAQRLAQGLEQQDVSTSVAQGFGVGKVSHTDWTSEQFVRADALVFVGATGIAVRSIAPHVVHKACDPAVIVIDERGENCIPLLSGHLGGANRLARTLSDYCGARTVVTTASDLNHVFAVDSWAAEQDLVIPDTSGIKVITSALLKGEQVICTTNVPIAGIVPKGIRLVSAGDAQKPGFREYPGFHVGARLSDADLDIVVPTAVLGIGCRKGTAQEDIEYAVSQFLEDNNVHPASLCCIASVDLKAEEPGLVAFAESRDLPFVTFDAETLNALPGQFSSSEFVQGVTGTSCVCERAAVATGGKLMVKKTVINGITLALSLKKIALNWPECQDEDEEPQQCKPRTRGKGSLWVVGLGPGDPSFMSQEAIEALQTADMICGYHVYVDLAKQVAPNTPVFTTPMTKEIDRCRAALETAAQGKRVAMVCSGDAGVFGMAGLCMELAHEFDPVDIRVTPGITAALSGASRLGAPLTHDFAVISLSDLLTPWELIEERLKAAASADFCVALYNPASHKRSDYLQKACDLMLAGGKGPQTICGVVRNIGRPGEETWVGTLEELRVFPADMFCTAFIGNSNTTIIDGKMVTPRGYQKKRQWNKED